MTRDRELLQRYVQQGDEAAFAEVVHRQADLVYSVALRVTANSALAQDVTQAVFTKLARQGSLVCQYDTLIGWLHTTTRRRAIDAIRGESRRRVREQEASAMHHNEPAATINWEAIAPLLDEAVGSLREDDRRAVLLRFFQNRSHQEIGAELGLTENSANKRLERALEKLRAFFARRGVTTTSAMLIATISTHSVQAAPAGLVEKITTASPAVVPGALERIIAKILFMSTQSKLRLAVLSFLLAVIMTAIFFWPTPEAPPRAPAEELRPLAAKAIEIPRLPPAVTASPAQLSRPGADTQPMARIVTPVSVSQTRSRTDIDLGKIALKPNELVQISMPNGQLGTIVGRLGGDGLVHVEVDLPVLFPDGTSAIVHDESITADRSMSQSVFGTDNFNVIYSTSLQED